MPEGPGRWSTAKATNTINDCAGRLSFTLSWRLHAKDQMRARDILIGDVLYVLRNGFVLDEPRAATRPGFFKYLIESTSPNSGGRKIGVVVIPDDSACALKIITVMWRDEL